MKKITLKKENLFFIFVFVLLAVYMGVFFYLNMAKYAQHVDSDIAAEALLAREMWETKSLTPDNWIASTERHSFGMPGLAALFYGITGSMQIAVGIACVLLGGSFAVVFYLFGRRLRLSRLAAGIALLVLCAMPINGLRNEGQMLPFLMLSLFLFAEYYVLHSILLFLSIMLYLFLREKTSFGLRAKEGAAWLFLFCFAAALSFEGERCLQIVILPLIITEAIFLFVDTDKFRKKPDRCRLIATGFVGTMVAAFLITSFYSGRIEYPLYLLAPSEVTERLFKEVPAALLEGFGIAGKAKVGNFASVMQLLIWAFLALGGYGLFLIYRNKNAVPARQRQGLSMLLISLGVTCFAVVITSAEPAQNYFFVSWFAAAFVTGIMVDYFQKQGSFFAKVILLAVCGFALLNLNYTYKPAMFTEDNLKDYKEVADFLVESDIQYGYGEFWDAARISLICDGSVTMGHSYRIEELGMYYWLTSTEWYPPNLPVNMRTAYVVRSEKKEAFEAQFAQSDEVELYYENDTFAVYLSDTNYVTM